jgi:hypothetical protein
MNKFDCMANGCPERNFQTPLELAHHIMKNLSNCNHKYYQLWARVTIANGGIPATGIIVNSGDSGNK